MQRSLQKRLALRIFAIQTLTLWHIYSLFSAPKINNILVMCGSIGYWWRHNNPSSVIRCHERNGPGPGVQIRGGDRGRHVCRALLLELQTKIREYFTITEEAPIWAFSCLKAPTSAFTFKALLRHYTKWALTHCKQAWNWDAEAIIIRDWQVG